MNIQFYIPTICKTCGSDGHLHRVFDGGHQLTLHLKYINVEVRKNPFSGKNSDIQTSFSMKIFGVQILSPTQVSPSRFFS